jgi:FkbH-like protein
MKSVFSSLLENVKEAIAAGRSQEALSLIASAATPELDLTETTQLIRVLKAVPAGVREQWIRRTVRVAIFSGSTTAHLRSILEFFFFTKRIKLELWLSDYNFEAAIAAKDAEVLAFRPDICLLSGADQNIENRSDVQKEIERWISLQKSLHDWLGALVLQEGFCLPPERPLGHFEDRAEGGPVRFTQELNIGLRSASREGLIFLDIDFEAARVGRHKWFDRRFWYEAKYAVSPDASAAYCHRVAAAVASIYGLRKKCLVLDLDNTLWGGVIGDDGLNGISFGEGSGSGEAYKAFQRYAKTLKQQGVLLAVCSKNEESIAQEPFLKNPEFVLKLEDFSSFCANWSPKGQNLATIAKKLNIGMDSLVFFDDNPVERAQVHQSQPDVFVVEGLEDPSEFIERLDSLLLFEPHNLTREDVERSQLYAADRNREALAEAAPDYDSYLASLRMNASATPFSGDDMARITQLINKTNQFNLTTRRYTELECTAFATDSSYLTRSIRLKDKFGDNGLISALIGRVYADGKTLEIDTWVMSCRVLRRGVEHLLMNEIAEEAKCLGVSRIIGTYIPTEKNKMVAELYSQLGFRLAQERDNGTTIWELATPFQVHRHNIERTRD